MNTVDAQFFSSSRKPVLLAEALAHFTQQPVVRHGGQIGDSNRGRITASAGPAAHHQRNPGTMTQGDQPHLVGHGVDGIHYEVRAVFGTETGLQSQQARRRIGREKLHPAFHPSLWGNGPNPFRHDFHLGPSHRGIQRMQLPVDVADAHVVEINQGESTYPRTGERFYHPGAHAANADH